MALTSLGSHQVACKAILAGARVRPPGTEPGSDIEPQMVAYSPKTNRWSDREVQYFQVRREKASLMLSVVL
jgi:hypothetical protein